MMAIAMIDKELIPIDILIKKDNKAKKVAVTKAHHF